MSIQKNRRKGEATTDIIKEYRDHSQLCEHGQKGSHQFGHAGVRHSGIGRKWCPGGKEIRMRRWRAESAGWRPAGTYVWVEVDGNAMRKL